MAVPTLSFTSVPALAVDADVLVLGVLQTEAGPKLLSDDPSFAGIAAAMTQIGVSGAVDELKRLPSRKAQRRRSH